MPAATLEIKSEYAPKLAAANTPQSGNDSMLAEIELAAGRKFNRRSFLKLTGLSCGGFALAMYLPESKANGLVSHTNASAQLNAFITIAANGRVTIFAGNPDMGQGVKTSIPMIAAEELGVKWSDVTVLQAPINRALFGEQRAGGSTTTPRCFDQMRRVGAAARQMLIGAAASMLKVPAAECKTIDSHVVHEPTGHKLPFSQLVAAAAKQPAPTVSSLKFKERKEYRLLGTRVSGVDNPAIVTGQPLFGIDTQVPDMLYAVYQKSPRVYGKAVRANLDEVKAQPGVVDAFILDGNGEKNGLLSGVAIVGKSTWAVMKAKTRLKVQWDESNASRDSWTDLVKQAKSAAEAQGSTVVTKVGNVDAQFANADNKVIKSFYTYPFVYHACLEPMNCTAHFKQENKTVEVWVPTQAPERIFPMVEKEFGVPAANVKVNLTRIGGAFGRRGSLEFVQEALAISKQVGKPVKLTWTREDDFANDYFRVGGFQSLRGAVDKNGKLVAWDNHLIGMSHQGQPANGVYFAASEFPMLNVANVRGTRTLLSIKTSTGPWRAPGANTMSWPVQSFIHELAHAAGRDHVQFLLEMMGEPRWFEPNNVRSLNTGRAAAVIKLAAEKSGWGKSLPKGRSLGFAFHFCHAAHVAEVAEISVDAHKKVTVHRVTAAVDIGPIVNLSGATAQVEGSILDGLSTMLGLEVTMEDGLVQQSNFHNYKLMGIRHAPSVDVHFIESEYAPT
ncbi:MAG TPA: molybdopterin cofactor-binding domain-containing protein, partial [Steroidobacteraceae bacterium]|nr:molybdopterin cofactor-binding domain-containing protein [Steroidobacteraceae bacterium]